MHDNTNPQPVSTNESIFVLFENTITTYLETYLLSTYTLLNAYWSIYKKVTYIPPC